MLIGKLMIAFFGFNMYVMLTGFTFLEYKFLLERDFYQKKADMLA